MAAVMSLAGCTAHAATYTYTFFNTLAPLEGSGTVLVPTYNNGTFVNGSFVDTTINEVCPGTLATRGWSFPQYGGLKTPYPPAVVGGSYTISMIVKFHPMKSGYSRLIDFSNSTRDPGIYELNGGLLLYPVGTFAPNSFWDNASSFVTFTRDGASRVISVFVGTTPAGTYTDIDGLYDPSQNFPPAQNVIFFMDNTAGPSSVLDSSAGVISYLKLSDTPVTAGEIAALQLEACTAIAAPVVSSIDPASGPTTGGTIVTITGGKFTETTVVEFGPNAAATFNVDSDTQITATSPAGAPGFVHVAVSAGNASSATGPTDAFTYTGVLDIDADGQYDALTDGLLIIRYLSGLIDTTLPAGAIGSLAARTDPVKIFTYLDNVRSLLDVDDDNQTDALTDGLMIMRYLFGLRGDALVADAVGMSAKRDAAQIADYIQSLMP